MSIKIVLLKSGEQIISDVHEVCTEEDKTIGYSLTRPCTIHMQRISSDDLISTNEPTPFELFIAKQTATQKLIAHCAPLSKTSIQSIEPSNDLLLLIGPEGDFAPLEIESALAYKFTPIDLGPTRLRTETAGIFALSCLKNF